MTLDKFVALCTWVIGQLPWIANYALTYFGLKQISIYQNPSVYQGKELFLIVPVAVGLFATWVVFKFETKGMIVVFVAFLILASVVLFIFDYFPVDDKIHSYNWFLFYCLPALAFAMVGGLVSFMTKFTRSSDAIKRFQADFGDARSLEFSIRHNLKTLDVIVSVRSNIGSRENVIPDHIERISDNEVRIVCPNPPPGQNEFRAVVIA